MCIIVDANRLGAFLADPPGEDAAPLRAWLNRGGRIVYSTGGVFAKEVGHAARERLRTWVRRDMATLVSADRFADDEHRLRADPDLRSDDPHVLALAREAKVRLLHTGDADLTADFKNRKFIDRPRGKVYSSAANARLLATTRCAT